MNNELKRILRHPLRSWSELSSSRGVKLSWARSCYPEPAFDQDTVFLQAQIILIEVWPTWHQARIDRTRRRNGKKIGADSGVDQWDPDNGQATLSLKGNRERGIASGRIVDVENLRLKRRFQRQCCIAGNISRRTDDIVQLIDVHE